MNESRWHRKVLFIVMCISISASLQQFQRYFIYWHLSFFSELWRWWTAHWVHVGWLHFALNLCALICLPFVFPQVKNRYFLLLLLILPPCISLTFHVFYPHIDAYAGLSGVLHGMYVSIAIYYLKDSSERKFAAFVLLFICIKIAWENMGGSLHTAELIGSPVLLQAHVWGAIWGAFFSGLVFIYQALKQKRVTKK